MGDSVFVLTEKNAALAEELEKRLPSRWQS
jgi:hypothetical protein